MKNKKYFLIILVVLVCILITAFSITILNNRRDINNLISQLESAINKHDIQKIIELYPAYCRDKVAMCLSQDKLDEFYNNVIIKDNENINIQIIKITNFDTSSCDEIMEQILDDYNQNIIIEDYQLVQIKYHENFSESYLQVIKINGDYYLYFYGFLGEPISYFQS